MLKREVQGLPKIESNVKQFQKNWVKTVRANSNSHLPFLQELSSKAKEELNALLEQANVHVKGIKESQVIQDKLQMYARQLVDLKLAHLRENKTRVKQITQQLTNDEFLKMQNTIQDVKKLKEHTSRLEEHYEAINTLLHKELSLEESVFFMDLPHKLYLYNLVKTAIEHSKITRKLGLEFVNIVKQAKEKKGEKK